MLLRDWVMLSRIGRVSTQALPEESLTLTSVRERRAGVRATPSASLCLARKLPVGRSFLSRIDDRSVGLHSADRKKSCHKQRDSNRIHEHSP